MSFSIYTAKALLNSLFKKTSDFGDLASAPTIYVGLSSTTPNENGTGATEPSTGSYARVATTASDWDGATTADPSVIANAEKITFPTATADWAGGSNLTHFVLYDASTSGNVLAFGELSSAKPVLNGDTAEFDEGDLTVSLD